MSNFNIIKLNAITSTNDWLKQKYDKNKCRDGDLVWANKQTKGRGQKDKVWISEPGKNLTFSFFKVLKKLEVNDQFIINCSVSLAIINALKKIYVPKMSLKWPNDILSENKKICGILIENFVKGGVISGTIVGVGLNVNQIDFEKLDGASSILNQTKKEFNLEFVLNLLLDSFEESFRHCKRKNKKHLIKEYEKLLFGKNQIYKFQIGHNIFDAIIKGVNLDGKLIVQNKEDEIVMFSSSTIKMFY